MTSSLRINDWYNNSVVYEIEVYRCSKLTLKKKKENNNNNLITEENKSILISLLTKNMLILRVLWIRVVLSSFPELCLELGIC